MNPSCHYGGHITIVLARSASNVTIMANEVLVVNNLHTHIQGSTSYESYLDDMLI